MPSFKVMSEVDRRRDPRAEPDEGDDLGSSQKIDKVERPFERRIPTLTLRRDEPGAVEDDPELSEATSEIRAVAARAAGTANDQASPNPNATVQDEPAPDSSSIPRRVERLVDEGNWEGICAMLGPSDKAAELPPHLAIVYALARAESNPEDASVVEIAIRSTERAHGLPEGSPIARVIAKRLLRRSPREWRKRSAPRGYISILIVCLTLVLGGGGGFWLRTTKVQIPLPSFSLSR